jgi:hypothetical protein
VDADELWLVVDEGDNAPLPLVHARLLLPSYRLRFFAPAGGGLRLLYGRDDLEPPRYDLALLAPTLMGAAATEVTAGPTATSEAAAAVHFAALVLAAAVRERARPARPDRASRAPGIAGCLDAQPERTVQKCKVQSENAQGTGHRATVRRKGNLLAGDVIWRPARHPHRGISSRSA